MEAFKTFRGEVATLERANVDTDQIIPKQFLKSIERTGFGPALFFAVGLVALIRYLRRRNAAIKDAPLSADEQAEVDRLLSAKETKD